MRQEKRNSEKSLTRSQNLLFFKDDGHYHHHSLAGGGAPLIYFHHGSFSPVAVAGGIVITSLSMIGVAVACWVLMGRRRKLAR